jgi:hypothetical protein
MDKILRYAAYAGIIYLILDVPLVALEVMKIFEPLSGYLLMAYVALTAASGIAGIIIYWGFKILGEKTQNKLLELVSLAGILSIFLFTGYSLADTLMDLGELIELALGGIMLIGLGLFSIIFGIAVIKLKDKFGNLATILAITEIVTGIGMATILLSPLALLTAIIASILEIIILWKASNTY